MAKWPTVVVTVCVYECRICSFRFPVVTRTISSKSPECPNCGIEACDLFEEDNNE